MAPSPRKNFSPASTAFAKKAASALFDRLDRDKDGTLDRRELRGRLNPTEFKAADPMTNLVKATAAAPVTPSNAAPSNIVRPPAPTPTASRDAGPASASRRVASVQRALTEYGYGQLKPTGTVGSDTQVAIVKFERERKIPATGQMNERLVRELSAMIGHSID